MMEIDPKQYLSFKLAGEVRAILKPLQDYLGIGGLHFNRFYKGATSTRKEAFYLHTEPRMLLKAMDTINTTDTSDLFPASDGHLLYEDLLQRVSQFKELKKYEAYQRTMNEFGFGSELSIIKRYKDYTDCFDFFPDLAHSASAVYLLDKRQVLEHFIHYFYDQAAPFLDVGFQNRFVFKKEPIYMPGAAPAFPSTRDAFLAAAKVKNFYFMDAAGHPQTLTKREWQCAKRLQDGYTTKQIAQSLKLSPRTVDDYIDRLKQKFDCLNRSQLAQRLSPLTFPLEE